MSCPTSPDYPVAETAGRVLPCRIVQSDKNEALGTLLAQVAKGEVPLSALGGMDAKMLAQILSQAVAQMQVGRDDKAVPILEVLIALDPPNPIFHEYLGLAAERLGDHDRAYAEYSVNIGELERAGNKGDRLCEAYLLRARLSALKGEMSLAADDLVKAHQHDQGHDAELRQELKLLQQAVEGAR